MEKNVLKLGMLEGSTPVSCLLEIDTGPQELGRFLELPYLVSAELPGVRKEDIQVTIDGAQVTLSAEVKRESEEKDKKEDDPAKALLKGLFDKDKKK